MFPRSCGILVPGRGNLLIHIISQEGLSNGRKNCFKRRFLSRFRRDQRDPRKQKGWKKVFVTSDPDLIKFGVTAKVTDLLDEAGISYSVYSKIKPNPTIQNVQEGVAAFKEAEADSIIAIGGGSSMDTAKAIGIIINNPEFEDVRSLEGVAPVKHHAVPTIAVPTTAGTAAEVTINYVITDPEKERKFVCVGPEPAWMP